MVPYKKQEITEYGLFGDGQRYQTVADIIEKLKTLDQDKHIYVEYDGGCYVFAPLPDRIDEDGDYVIIAG